MLIDLTQHATRCSDNSGQAQEYLIARHAAVETETVLVQICLELGAPSVICSLKECFQITDCLVYPICAFLPPKIITLHYLSYIKFILCRSLSYDKLHRKTATPIFRSGRRFCYARLRRYSSTF